MSKDRFNVEAIIKAIEIAGGMTKLCSKAHIGYQSLLDWKSGRKAPSSSSCLKIEKATNGEVKAEDILPDFPWHTMR